MLSRLIDFLLGKTLIDEEVNFYKTDNDWVPVKTYDNEYIVTFRIVSI